MKIKPKSCSNKINNVVNQTKKICVQCKSSLYESVHYEISFAKTFRVGQNDLQKV